MAPPKTRMKEIAESTGFSLNTVSLALRGSGRLSEKTRTKILREAERQNYVPNHIARSLASRSTRTVGLVLTDIMNPTITLTARTIERLLTDSGYGVMFATSDNKLANEKSAISLFQSHQVDGIIVYPTNRADIAHLQAARRAGTPMLVLADIPADNLDVVAIDDRKGAAAAVRHLLSLGHRQIALLDGGYTLGNTEKLDGARGAVAAAGLPETALTLVDPEGHSALHGYTAISNALAGTPRPTAVFATTDALAIGAVRWCTENNISIPDDLAVIGYDDTELAAFCSTPLTTMRYAAADVSQIAVARIIELIEADTTPSAEINLIVPDIVKRASC